jgi:SNF2 family DNA or RNA helicase
LRVLYEYQRNMVDYLISHPKAALFAEMRLGKCITTIRALKHLPGRKLIICPKAVINTWCDELEMEEIRDYGWFSSEELSIFRVIPGLGLWVPGWIIMNYEAVTRLSDIELLLFKHVVIDESVRIKNPKAQITRFLLKNFEGIERKILLSGNPAPNSPLEYFTQMQFLYGSWMNCDNYWKFRHRYFSSDLQGWNWWTRRGSAEAIKAQLQKNCFFLSRKEVGVENKKVYAKRIVEMPKELAKKYRQMEKAFMTTLPNGKTLETKWVLSQFLYLQEMASGHILNQEISDFKIKELVELLEGELKGEKVLIWCRFRWEIDAIAKFLTKKGIMSGIITGDTPLNKRKALQENFQGNKLDILCMQIATGKHGLNFSAADTMIYFSNTFSSDDRTQSEARIESNTKSQPLLYIDLITKGTIEEDILKALQTKKRKSEFYMTILENMKERNV